MSDRQTFERPLTATFLLHCCACIVPARDRWEWRQEWHSELWYVYRESEALSAFGIWSTCTRFALGAVNDALWLRCNAETPRGFLQSARDCATWLVLLSACTFVVAVVLPGSREALTSMNRPATRNVVSITRAGLISHTAPTIDLDEYEHWNARGGKWFSDVAFYRVTKADITAPFANPAQKTVAVATQSFARILDLEVSPDAAATAATHHCGILLLAPAAHRTQLQPEH